MCKSGEEEDIRQNDEREETVASTKITGQTSPDDRPPFWKVFIPAIIVGGLILIYAVFISFFIQCRWKELCSPIDGLLISVIDENKKVKLSCASEKINAKQAVFDAAEKTLSERRALQKTAEENLALTRNRLDKEKLKLAKLTGEVTAAPDEDEIVGEVEPAQSPPADSAATDVAVKIKAFKQTEAEQELDLKKRETSAAKALTARDAAREGIVDFRKNISARYTSRSLWAFFTGLYLVLFIVAVWFTVSVMNRALSDLPEAGFFTQQRTWHVLTVLTAVGLFILICSRKDSFMSVIGPMYGESIFAVNEIPEWLPVFFYALAFAAVVYMVAASCAMLYAVKQGRDIEYWRDNSRILLYISGLLWFVGLLRMDILSKWHLIFIDSHYQGLLQDFFKNSLTVQALFFTVVIAAVYLPLSYEFPPTQADPSVEESLSDNGFFATITKFAPRFLLLISPLLAGPIVDLFKILIGGDAQ